MQGSLATTNVLLGVMAFVSVLEGLLVVGCGVAGYLLYRRVMHLLNGLETRQIAPAMLRVNAILDDVKSMSATMKQEAERVDRTIHAAINRVDGTADRVRSSIRSNSSRVIGFVRGARVAIESMLRPSNGGKNAG